MQGQGPSTLLVKGRIELPNVDGRIDHFSADVKGQRLFMSALGRGSSWQTGESSSWLSRTGVNSAPKFSSMRYSDPR